MEYDFSKRYTSTGFFIPMRMMPALERYIKHGDIPGHFLQKVICNDLFGAVAHADKGNLMNLSAFVSFFYNEAPGTCWGSVEKMKAWSDHDGIEGLRKSHMY